MATDEDAEPGDTVHVEAYIDEGLLHPQERAAAILSEFSHRAAVTMARMRERTYMTAWALTDEDRRDRLIRVIPPGGEFRLDGPERDNTFRYRYHWTSTETVACLLDPQPEHEGIPLEDRLPLKAPPPFIARLGRSWR